MKTRCKDKTGTDNLSYECMVKIAELVEPQESEKISERNMKMWEEIFKAESEE